MSKKLFFKKFIQNRKELGSITPSSSFLAKKMVKREDIEKSEVIVEIGAGTGVFTKYIFKYMQNDQSKQVFIVEKDIDLYKILLKKFPKNKEQIYNLDIIDLPKIFEEKNIKKIDLCISSLPFKSLPKELFIFVMENFLDKYMIEKSKFIQFSYFKTFAKNLCHYFSNIESDLCVLNIPSAYVFTCSKYKKGQK